MSATIPQKPYKPIDTFTCLPAKFMDSTTNRREFDPKAIQICQFSKKQKEMQIRK